MNTSQELIFFEPYTLWYYPWWRNEYVVAAFWIICAALVIALIVFFVYRFLVRRKKAYWYRAQQHVKQLMQQPAMTHDDVKKLYCQLTSLMKTYLSDRYKKDYAALTDHEMLTALQIENLTAEQKRDLTTIFTGSDPIKFAHEEMPLAKFKQDAQAALEVVKETKPS